VSIALVRSVEIAASPEVVWQLLTDGERVQRWMGIACDIDARAGGIFRLDINRDARARGEVIAAEPGRMLRLSFGWEHGNPAPGSTTLTFTLEQVPGGTRVTLVHEGLTEAERREHDRGWAHYLERLRVVAAGGDPGPDDMTTAEEDRDEHRRARDRNA
jgi:uncharacterized protein YndB with AHSA1/START domain